MRAGMPFFGAGLQNNSLGYPSRPEQGVGVKDENTKEVPQCRAIFISDLHIGTPGFQADASMDFLKHHPSEMLYLVGDIVDGWQLRRR